MTMERGTNICIFWTDDTAAAAVSAAAASKGTSRSVLVSHLEAKRYSSELLGGRSIARLLSAAAPKVPPPSFFCSRTLAICLLCEGGADLEFHECMLCACKRRFIFRAARSRLGS